MRLAVFVFFFFSLSLFFHIELRERQRGREVEKEKERTPHRFVLKHAKAKDMAITSLLMCVCVSVYLGSFVGVLSGALSLSLSPASTSSYDALFVMDYTSSSPPPLPRLLC